MHLTYPSFKDICVTWFKVWSSLTIGFVSFIANCSNVSIAIMLLSLFENKSLEAVERKSCKKYTTVRINFLKSTDFFQSFTMLKRANLSIYKAS